MRTPKTEKRTQRFFLAFGAGAAGFALALAFFAMLLLKKDVSAAVLPYLYIGAAAVGAGIFAFLSAGHTGLRGPICGLVCGAIEGAIAVAALLLINRFRLSPLAVGVLLGCLIAGVVCAIVRKNLKIR